MNEGDLAVITGKLDSRVREKERKDGVMILGTIWWLEEKMATVLLPDGDLWRGPRFEICLLKEQIEESED